MDIVKVLKIRFNKHLRQHKTIVGRECTGKAHWQGSDKNPPDGGPRHMASCQGGALCLYCAMEDINTEDIYDIFDS